MPTPQPLTADQAAAVRDHLAPMADYLSRLNKRRREVGYSSESPLLKDVVAADIRVEFLMIRLREMAEPGKAEFRLDAAKDRKVIEPMGGGDEALG